METFSTLLALCAGNSPVTSEFPAQRPATRSLDVFSDLRLNKRLSKQSWGWWFETLSSSLWRHCNVIARLKAILYNSHQREDCNGIQIQIQSHYHMICNSRLFFSGRRQRRLQEGRHIRMLLRIRGNRQTSNKRRILVGNKIVDHSDVVGTSPVGAAPIHLHLHSRFNTWLQWIGRGQLQGESRNT